MIFISLGMLIGSIFWEFLFLFRQYYQLAIIPFVYMLVTILNLIVFHKTKNFNFAKKIQTSLSILLPFVLQWAMGGMLASGFMMIWSLLSLITTLTYLNRKSAQNWLYVFLFLGIASAGLEWAELTFSAKNHSEWASFSFLFNFSFVSVLLFNLLLFFVRRQEITQAYLNLSQKELNRAFSIIQSNHQQVTDSLNYAQRIQTSIQANSKRLFENLGHNFIYYVPKDIVSGDFYWAYKTPSQKLIWMTADCTGHGVPGAFISTIGNILLNEIVINKKIEEPFLVLNKLRTSIIQSLGYSEDGQVLSEGMDCSLCCWDLTTNYLKFSGAYNSIYLVRESEESPKLIELKADRMPVGFQRRKFESFTQEEIKLVENDTIYSFSDGFIDQISENNRKYMKKRFRELLLEIHNTEIVDQYKRIDKTFKEWKGSAKQIDDVCIIGIKFTKETLNNANTKAELNSISNKQKTIQESYTNFKVNTRKSNFTLEHS